MTVEMRKNVFSSKGTQHMKEVCKHRQDLYQAEMSVGATKWKEGKKGRYLTSPAQVNSTQWQAVGTKDSKKKVVKNWAVAEMKGCSDRRGHWSLSGSRAIFKYALSQVLAAGATAAATVGWKQV